MPRCDHKGALLIQANDPMRSLRVYDSESLVRVQARSLRALQWCARCGSLGYDGAWVAPMLLASRLEGR
jgi:hypothetical protein